MRVKKRHTRVLLPAALALWSVSAVTAASCVTATVDVAVSPARAWAILSDFGVAHLYVPDLTRTEIVSAKARGLGAHRRVYQSEDDYLDETVIEWREGDGFIITLHEGEDVLAPFTRAEFNYALQAAPAGGTTVELSMLAQMPWGKFGEKLGDWFITPVLEDTLVQVAAGLKSFYETGQPATDEDRERLAGNVTTSVDGPACEAFH